MALSQKVIFPMVVPAASSPLEAELTRVYDGEQTYDDLSQIFLGVLQRQRQPLEIPVAPAASSGLPEPDFKDLADLRGIPQIHSFLAMNCLKLLGSGRCSI